MKDDDRIALVVEQLRWLKLPGMTRTLPSVIARAAATNMTPLDIVGALADAERQSRIESAVKRRVHNARFPEISTIDGFDFNFDSARRKAKTRHLALADLGFIDRGVCPIFVGPPGTGKTFLARALAYRACQATKSVLCASAPRMLNDLQGAELHGHVERVLRRYTAPALLVVDDFAVLEMDTAQAKLAFQVISDRYERRIRRRKPCDGWRRDRWSSWRRRLGITALATPCHHEHRERGDVPGHLSRYPVGQLRVRAAPAGSGSRRFLPLGRLPFRRPHHGGSRCRLAVAAARADAGPAG